MIIKRKYLKFDGTHTTDADDYAKSWENPSLIIEKKLGVTVRASSHDGFVLEDPKNPNAAWANINFWLAKKIIEL